MSVLALVLLYEAVVARMDAEAIATSETPTPHAFGWREPARRQDEAVGVWRRVVWVPGDDGDLGDLLPARQPGRNPRPIATIAELFTVYLEAADRSTAATAENELAQYTATRLLFDAWLRAARLHAGEQLVVESARWVTDKTTRRFGATLRVVCSIQAMVPDAPVGEIAGEDDAYARGLGTTEELDQLDGPDATRPAPPAARAASTAPLVLSGLQFVDGVAVLAGERVLVKDQATSSENGLYVVDVAAWPRAADVLEHGFFTHIDLGLVNGAAGFELITADPIVVGTTPLTFVRVSP